MIQKGLVISPTSADLATLKTDMEAASKQRVTAEVIDRSIELQSNVLKFSFYYLFNPLTLRYIH